MQRKSGIDLVTSTECSASTSERNKLRHGQLAFFYHRPFSITFPSFSDNTFHFLESPLKLMLQEQNGVRGSQNTHCLPTGSEVTQSCDPQ